MPVNRLLLLNIMNERNRVIMKYTVNAIWFPWLAYAVIVVKSIVDFVVSNPAFGNGDEILLYGTVFVVLWIERSTILATINTSGSGYPLPGLLLAIGGVIVYMIGRLYPLFDLEIWSFFIIAASMVLALSPKENLRSAIFIGASGTILAILGRLAPELLSSQLAMKIASLSAAILSATILPVIANGVYLYFGPYSAEVTYACSGMNSIFSLFALSLLYLREGITRKYWHVAILVLLVIPVAVLTNMVRVIMLVLATWYVGDGFASGVFHDFAGIVVFVVALGLMYLIDMLLLKIDKSIEAKYN